MIAIGLKDLKIAILQELADTAQPVYKYNLLWSNYPGRRGLLEHRLGVTFDDEQRSMAARAFFELRAAGFIRMANTTPNPDPENWVVITEPGREALRNGLPSEEDKRGIFISHISDEASLAQLLQNCIRDVFGEGTPVFVSSDYRSIGGGEEWFPKIVNSIKGSKAVVVLLSKDSVERRWINFEAGLGLGAGCRVIPLVISDLDKGGVGLPLSQLQVRDLNDTKDANGLFVDLAEAIGAGNAWTVDVGELRKHIEEMTGLLPRRGVSLEPRLSRVEKRFSLDFALKHTGTRDVRLIKLWAAVPQHLIANAVHNGYNPPVLMIYENEIVDGSPHQIKEYHCTDAPISSGYDQAFRRLPRVFQHNMSPYPLPRFYFPIRGELTDAEKNEFIQFQVFAEDLATTLEKIQIKEILP